MLKTVGEKLQLKFVIEINKFTSGEFCDVYKATLDHKNFGKQWVLKKYKHDQAESIKSCLNITLDNHTKK